jgi:glycine cleavage system pyridoxal-binding protein P
MLMNKIQMLKDIIDYEIENYTYEDYHEHSKYDISRGYFRCLLSYQELIQKLIDLDLEEFDYMKKG